MSKVEDIELAEGSREFVDILKEKLGELMQLPKEEYEKKKAGVVVEAKREVIRRRIFADMYFLSDKILGIGEWYLKPKKHLLNKRYWRKRLDPVLHGQMCREMMQDENTLQLYPRNHMKSTMLKVWIIWMILKNPLISIGLFTKTMTLARKELSSIKAMLDNPLLRELFPEIVPERKEWEIDNQNHLVMKRPKEYSKQEGQIDVYGIDNGIAGHHYDAHCYDDIIDDKTVRSASQIEKVLSSWQMLQVVKDVGAIEKVVGTRYHLHDIYGHIIAQKLFLVKDTIIKKCHTASGRPIYSLFTNKDLDRLKKIMGDANFSTQMDNDPVAASDKIFTGPYPVYDMETMAKIVPKEHREYYAAIDPAATATVHSDQSGISVGFVDRRDPRCLFMERSYGVKFKAERLAAEFISIQEHYNPKVFGIESGLQTALQTVIQLKAVEWQKRMHRALNYNMLPISTGNMAKAVKFSRILSPFLNDRRILYPAVNNGGELELWDEFKTVEIQLDFYNPFSNRNDDDIIDSQNMLIQCVPHFSQSHWFNVKREEASEGFTYESIYKRFYANKEGGWGSTMNT